ncbi:MAG TPA: hypothetical protein VLJ38_21715 [Polyangiaceae bacterium]|nr:hypothetical protein [Polyangiaceae bacterium]
MPAPAARPSSPIQSAPTAAAASSRVYTPASVISAAPMVPVTPANTAARGPSAEPPAIGAEAPTAPGMLPTASTRSTVPALLHQAVRASVEPTNEAGVFRLKLLAANEMASLSGHEALVVLLDPSASLLRE